MLVTERPTGPRRSEVQEEFRVWLRTALSRQGLSQADLAWRFPFQVHPKTVADWCSGRGRPSYEHLVGLVAVLGELPPVLREFCPSVDAPG